MLAYASRKNKRGGGSQQQPLAYIDATEPVPNAPAGSNLLVQRGLIVRPAIDQTGGGSVQQPLPYLDPTISSPSAPSGSDILGRQGLIVRPAIERQAGGSKGGFIPSVMKGVVNSGIILAPLATVAAHRMLNSTRKRGGGKKEDWARNREIAREELGKYGKPSGINVNKFAALKRKSEEQADAWLTEYILRKRKTAKKPKTGKKQKETKKAKANVTKKNKTQKVKKTVKRFAMKTAELWKNLVDRARINLGKFGKPSGPNLQKYASLKRKGENTTAFLSGFKTKKQYKSPEPKARNIYQANMKNARQYLATLGKPTVANVTKFVSLKRKGQSTKGIETAVKARVKTVKTKSRSSLPKPTKPNYKVLYSKAKENLATIKPKPKAYEIAKLASIRRKGVDNTSYLDLYRVEK